MTPNVMKYTLNAAIGILIVAVAIWFAWNSLKLAPDNLGSILGTTNYPSDYIPEQIVCAEPVDGGSEICTDVPAGDSENLTPTWTLKVPEGRYYISSHVKDPEGLGSDMGNYRAYYTVYVTCGLNYACRDHTKIPIDVANSTTVKDIAPYDWYIR